MSNVNANELDVLKGITLVRNSGEYGEVTGYTANIKGVDIGFSFGKDDEERQIIIIDIEGGTIIGSIPVPEIEYAMIMMLDDFRLKVLADLVGQMTDDMDEELIAKIKETREEKVKEPYVLDDERAKEILRVQKEEV